MTRTVADQMVEPSPPLVSSVSMESWATASIASPMRCGAMAAFNGCMSGTRKSPRSPPAGTLMSQVVLRSAPEVAAQETCTSSMVCSTATAHACRWWRSRLTFPRPRSARAISRKPIPSSFFGNAPTIANLFRPSNRCPARSKSPYVVRCMSGMSTPLRRSKVMEYRPNRKISVVMEFAAPRASDFDFEDREFEIESLRPGTRSILAR
jgi:hypothetical protein